MYEPCDLYLDIINSGSAYYISQLHRLLVENDHSVNYEFLGFTDIYKALSEIIPKDRVVIDLGSFCGFQGWYFRDHIKYVAVDAGDSGFFKVGNGMYCHLTIAKFIEEHGNDWPLEQVFAICNYVPPWYEGSGDLVRAHYPNLFVYYPKTCVWDGAK